MGVMREYVTDVFVCMTASPTRAGEMEALEHVRINGIQMGASQLTKLPESLGSLKTLKILMLIDCEVLLQVSHIRCISRTSISHFSYKYLAS